MVVTIRPQPVAEGEQSSAPSLTAVMQEATNKVDLKKLGIVYLRPKRAKTGGLILEVPGEESAPKADRLAEKLRETIGDNEEVKITRPTRTAEFRVSGLDDAATASRVAIAVAEARRCSREDVKVGELRQALSGLRTAWVRCPKSVADKVTKAGKIKLGWTMAKIEALKTRSLQCHKCLCFGHVRAKCPNEIDRSGNCYRCGVSGHRAAGCTAALSCQLCEAKGKEKGHRLGGPSCPSSPNYKGKKRQGKSKDRATETRTGKGAEASKPKSQPKPRPIKTPRTGGKEGKGAKPNPKTLPIRAPSSKKKEKDAQAVSPGKDSVEATSSRPGGGLGEAMDLS